MNNPDSIVWLITSKCNLNCPYCYASIYSSERDLSLNEITSIIKDAYSIGIEYINITGGEPLLRKDIVDIVKVIKEYGIEVSIFSNLILLNREISENISKYIDYFLTTIDGPRNLYESIKGIGLWNRFLRNISLLRETGIDIHINIPVSKLNYNRIDEAIEQALGIGVSSISIIPAMATGRAVETKTYVTSIEFREALIRANTIARKYGLTIAAWCSPFIGVVNEISNVRFSNCRYWNVIDITPCGNVVLCDVTGLVISNVVKNGLSKSWRKLCEFKLINGIYEIPVNCRKCWFSNTCIGGCYARSYLETHSFNKPDPLCPLLQLSTQ